MKSLFIKDVKPDFRFSCGNSRLASTFYLNTRIQVELKIACNSKIAFHLAFTWYWSGDVYLLCRLRGGVKRVATAAIQRGDLVFFPFSPIHQTSKSVNISNWIIFPSLFEFELRANLRSRLLITLLPKELLSIVTRFNLLLIKNSTQFNRKISLINLYAKFFSCRQNNNETWWKFL